MAFRTQDVLDLERLLAANAGELDIDLIRREWATVADADDPRMIKFNAMLEEFYQSS